MFNKVIVGIDFTPKTERAIGVALNLAKATHGTVVLLHVLPAVAEEAQRTAPGAANDAMLDIEERLRDDAAALARSHHAHVDYGVVRGGAADEIVAYVKKWGGDAVVVSSEGRTGLGRILVGSVAEKLIQTCPVPVVVVGPAAH